MGIRQNDIVDLGPDCRELHVVLRRLPGLAAAGLNAAGIGFERTRYRIRRARCRFHQMLFTMAGEGRVAIDGRLERAMPGTVLITPAGCPQRYGLGAGRHWEICWFTCDPQHAGWTRRFHDNGICLRHERWAGQLRRIVYGLHREGPGTEADSATLCRHLGNSLRIYLERELAPPSPMTGVDEQRFQLRQMLEAVRDDLAADWSLDHLVAVSGMTVGTDHFTRLCRRELGQTPMQLVASMRLHHAADLLLGTDYTIETIGGLVGYGSPFALSNAFRRRFGVRPSTYREQA